MTNIPAVLKNTPDKLFITDGGLETSLIFHKGQELPLFAAFPLIDKEEGQEMLREYFLNYAAIAQENNTGLLLESPTWRASSIWASQLDYDSNKLRTANTKCIELLAELKSELAHSIDSIVISGNVGPKGDGYVSCEQMTIAEAAEYHGEQVETLKEAGADMIGAFTLNYVEEAVGLAQAASDKDIPIALSFTVETDGKLPCGISLSEAIVSVDELTNGSVAYFMINCAHPTHFEHVLQDSGTWKRRIKGIRANASKMSHAELDACENLDAGCAIELGQDYQRLRKLLPELQIIGGCCGTDHTHIAALVHAWMN